MRARTCLLPDRLGRIAKVAVNAGFAAALLFGALGFAVPTALAQNSQVKSLINRIDRLQREMSTLQRQVYRGETPPAAATDASAGAGGLSGTAAARVELRLSQIEAELRTLTGQAEEAAFRYNQLRERLDRLAADIDLRLQRLEQGAPAVAGSQGAPGAQIASTGGAQTFNHRAKGPGDHQSGGLASSADPGGGANVAGRAGHRPGRGRGTGRSRRAPDG